MITLLLFHSIYKDIDECAEITGICAFRCKNLAGSYMCDCPRGYQVAADGRMCEDIDECADRNLCQQRCKNLFGSHMCLCYDGYASVGDRCVGKCLFFNSQIKCSTQKGEFRCGSKCEFM